MNLEIAAPKTMTGAERFLTACEMKPVDCTPVWFMRQAGRCLADYRTLRGKYDILTITRTPELCAQVTKMPVEVLGVDAAVLYADIMLPLTGMGVSFSIDPGVGPIIYEPVRTAADVEKLTIVDAEEATPHLFESIRMLRQDLEGQTALIGFAGAPFTVASYLIEGRPSKDYARAKGLMHSDPKLWNQLMEKLTTVTVKYLQAQINAGVQAVQLFDSWVGSLSRQHYAKHVLPHSRAIFEGIKDTGIPTIHFGTGTGHVLDLMASAGSDMVSVDWRIALDEAWAKLEPQQGIQGNLDPTVMLAPFKVIEKESRDILRRADGRAGHIFNLGHGVLPDTPSASLARLVELVHETTKR